jgi:hypothetical protein
MFFAVMYYCRTIASIYFTEVMFRFRNEDMQHLNNGLR